MSFGRGDGENRGYAATLFENAEGASPDGLGVVSPGCLPEMRVTFSDADEVLGQDEGRRMTFVMQLDWELGQESPWAMGGYAYLFVCGHECKHREADLVVQTT